MRMRARGGGGRGEGIPTSSIGRRCSPGRGAWSGRVRRRLCPRGALWLAGHEKMWQKNRLEKVVIFVLQGAPRVNPTVAGLLGERVAITGDGPGDSRPPRISPTVAGLLGERVALTGDGPGDSRPPRFNPTVAGLLGERAAITGNGPEDSRPPRVNPTVARLLGERVALTRDGPGDSRLPRVNPMVAELLGERVALTGDGPGDSRPHCAYRSLPNSHFFALTFQKKCCRPSPWPRRTAALVTKTAQRVADPLRELGSKHAEVRAPAQAKFL